MNEGVCDGRRVGDGLRSVCQMEECVMIGGVCDVWRSV